jgi:hypothetical protein
MTTLSDVLRLMLEYQEKNNITSKCCENSLFFINYLKKHSADESETAKAVIVVVVKHEVNGKEVIKGLISHMVVQMRNGLLKTSYEVTKRPLESVLYIERFNQVKPTSENKEILHTLLSNHISLLAVAKKINAGCSVVQEDGYYKALELYVENGLSKL